MKDLMDRSLDFARLRGAQYADGRVVNNHTQNITVRDGVVESLNDAETIGFGLRVLADGAWGFASSRDLTVEEAHRVTGLALQLARPTGTFIYHENLQVDDIIDGDFCEFNSYEQTERVISDLYHKITFNPFWFSLNNTINVNNQFGYYYKPHNPITIRVFSDYIEEGESLEIVDIPDYSFYSNLSNSFRWRDLYPYGFIDGDGLGVDYPFMNGKHYPFVNTIFRLIPEGSQTANQFIKDIDSPTVDECE